MTSEPDKKTKPKSIFTTFAQTALVLGCVWTGFLLGEKYGINNNNFDLKKQTETLKKENESISIKNLGLEEKNKELQTKIIISEKNSLEKNKKIDQLVAKLKSEFDEIEKEKLDATAKLVELEKEKLKNQKNKINSSVSQKNKIKSLEISLKNLENDKKEYQKKLELINEQNSILKAQIPTYDDFTHNQKVLVNSLGWIKGACENADHRDRAIPIFTDRSAQLWVEDQFRFPNTAKFVFDIKVSIRGEDTWKTIKTFWAKKDEIKFLTIHGKKLIFKVTSFEKSDYKNCIEYIIKEPQLK